MNATLAAQIQQQSRIPAVAAQELADYALSGGYTSGTLLVGIGEYGYSPLYAVIYPCNGRWHIASGYIMDNGNFRLIDAATGKDAKTLRSCFHFTHHGATFVEFEPERETPPEPEPGEYIYVLKFDRPIGSDRHNVSFYGGWTRDFDARMECHKKGRGSRLTRWAVRNGIGWTVVYKAPGTTADEKRMKAMHGYRDFLASVGVAI